MDGLLLFTPSQRKVHLGMSCCRGFYTRHWFAANREIGTAKTKHVLNNPERKKLALSDLFSQIIFKIKIYTNCRVNWFRCTTGVQLGLIIITLFIKHTTFKLIGNTSDWSVMEVLQGEAVMTSLIPSVANFLAFLLVLGSMIYIS
jgi:hypothetical protein